LTRRRKNDALVLLVLIRITCNSTLVAVRTTTLTVKMPIQLQSFSKMIKDRSIAPQKHNFSCNWKKNWHYKIYQTYQKVLTTIIRPVLYSQQCGIFFKLVERVQKNWFNCLYSLLWIQNFLLIWIFHKKRGFLSESTKFSLVKISHGICLKSKGSL